MPLSGGAFNPGAWPVREWQDRALVPTASLLALFRYRNWDSPVRPVACCRHQAQVDCWRRARRHFSPSRSRARHLSPTASIELPMTAGPCSPHRAATAAEPASGPSIVDNRASSRLALTCRSRPARATARLRPNRRNPAIPQQWPRTEANELGRTPGASIKNKRRMMFLTSGALARRHRASSKAKRRLARMELCWLHSGLKYRARVSRWERGEHDDDPSGWPYHRVGPGSRP